MVSIQLDRLDHRRIVFYVEGESRYHELRATPEIEGHDRAVCGVATRTRGHECTARVAELMGFVPCESCRHCLAVEATSAGRPGGAAIQAVIFDTDGVVTRTAVLHEAAWKTLFDEILAARAARTGARFVAFSGDDYRRFVDGKTRADGVTSFLESRGIALPMGRPADPPDRETVHGLGARKNGFFLDRLHQEGVLPYESTLDLARRLRAQGITTAVVSASENGAEVVAAAGASDLFDVRVDGVDAAELGLPGKPDPALFLEAARRLGRVPVECAVIEDALAGVAAGRRGGFGLVVGVDRTGHPDALRQQGADVVVPDLAWLDVDAEGRWRLLDASRSAAGADG